MDTISAILKAITEALCFWRQKDAQKNTAVEIAGAQSAKEQKLNDKTAKAIKNRDEKEIENEIAQ